MCYIKNNSQHNEGRYQYTSMGGQELRELLFLWYCMPNCSQLCRFFSGNMVSFVRNYNNSLSPLSILFVIITGRVVYASLSNRTFQSALVLARLRRLPSLLYLPCWFTQECYLVSNQIGRRKIMTSLIAGRTNQNASFMELHRVSIIQ